MPTRSDRRRIVLVSAALLLLAGVAVWIRWPALAGGGFMSHDVAGILYEAMLLADGRLPYVDSVDMKPPGTFYLAVLLAKAGREIGTFQIAANLWALTSAATLFLLARRILEPRGALAALALYLLHDAFLDSMDANYVTWMQLPTILAFLASESARLAATEGRRRRQDAWLLAAGAAAGCGVLCKQPALFLLPVVVGKAVVEGGGLRARGGWRAGALVVAGVVAAHAPIVLHYAVRGELAALLSAYPLNRMGFAYLGRPIANGPLDAVLATAHFVGLPLVLALFVGTPRPGDVGARATPWLWAWFAAALASAFLGGRYYKGYFLVVVPPLVLLAAMPWGWLGPRPRGGRWLQLATLPLLVVLALRAGALLAGERRVRGLAHDSGAQRIARYVASHTLPEDRVWVWGWHLWGVYSLAGRFSPSPIFKTLSVITPPNDDTWRSPSSRSPFVDGPASEALLADLERDPPAYIILGGTVPREEFRGLQALLRGAYELDRGLPMGRVEIWHRRDHVVRQRAPRSRSPRPP